MKKLSACVGKFNHSAVNNSELKNVRELQKTFSKVYEFIRRNDTRWVILCGSRTGRSILTSGSIDNHYHTAAKGDVAKAFVTYTFRFSRTTA